MRAQAWCSALGRQVCILLQSAVVYTQADAAGTLQGVLDNLTSAACCRPAQVWHSPPCKMDTAICSQQQTRRQLTPLLSTRIRRSRESERPERSCGGRASLTAASMAHTSPAGQVFAQLVLCKQLLLLLHYRLAAPRRYLPQSPLQLCTRVASPGVFRGTPRAS